MHPRFQFATVIRLPRRKNEGIPFDCTRARSRRQTKLLQALSPQPSRAAAAALFPHRRGQPPQLSREATAVVLAVAIPRSRSRRHLATIIFVCESSAFARSLHPAALLPCCSRRRNEACEGSCRIES